MTQVRVWFRLTRSVYSQAGGVVGVDMEWQPTFGCSSAQKVSLIQLAVLDQVFLLDLSVSEFCRHPGTASFIRRLFSEGSVLKLGEAPLTTAWF